eukprot:CAMPEP_0177690750 /NCGR_PEP_ID=MMETSP0484_2-20121128/935_1 /TAXON_ID=354590 /ORGANISM="Rhodomonas lens, Strain RHODO" /LENGTH=290 /DNA_ID=CAMNT_0019201319 /DNA_START=227 /DNA_END=1096 /DNA_ORIENTATION=-
MNDEAASRCPAQPSMITSSNLSLRGGDDGSVLKANAGNDASNAISRRPRPHVDSRGCVHHALEDAMGGGEPRGDDEPGPALIMVNYKLNRDMLRRLWARTTVKICADGALNRLYNAFDEEEERQKYIPDYVRGDLDSVEDSVRDYYKDKNTKIVKYINQDTTDLEKCLELLESLETPFSQVIVLGAFGGRIDHEFSHYAVLYKYPQTDIVLVSHKRAAFLLRPGTHQIHTSLLGHNCGLIPLGEPVANVQTQGLKWDLQGQAMSMTGLLSTSNRIRQPVVDVTCSGPLLW